MDKLSLFGMLVAVVGIVGGQLLEGGSVSVLLQVAAFCIVFGGTIGAVMLHHPLNVFMTGIRMAGWVFVTPVIDTQKLAYQITAWGGVARKDGILALEAQLKNIDDPFVYKGLQMLVDGNSAEKIREVTGCRSAKLTRPCAGNRRACGNRPRVTRPPSVSSVRCWGWCT